MATQFKYLFSPLKLNSVIIPNRIVVTAHDTGLMRMDGPPTEKYIKYMEAKAKGGAGLIICGLFHVAPMTTAAPRAALQDDSAIPAWKKLADAIHRYDTKYFARIDHIGIGLTSRDYGGALLGPSAIPARRLLSGLHEIPHEMTIDEIKEIVECFSNAAHRLKESGADGLEIGAMYLYLVATFMSPLFNKRTDEYGGSLENRLRFPTEMLTAIRRAVGPDYPLGIRIVADEFVEGGNTGEDMKEIARCLEATGLVDWLDFAAGQTEMLHVPPMYFPLGAFRYLAAGLREEVDLPILHAGRINDPVLAEQILAEGQADMVGMCRACIADPEMPNKAREGRLDEIRHCIACVEACLRHYYIALPIVCAINPEVGNEAAMTIVPTATRRKVMVIGGGAAGLEAARVAAMRGHHVSLYEKDKELGGQLNLAAKTPGRVDFDEVTRYYTYQMKLLKVDVHLEAEVAADMVRHRVAEGEVDAVVIATGSVPQTLDIPGVDNATNVVDVRDVIADKVEVGQNVIILAGEHQMQAGCTADFLAERGKKIELINESFYAFGQVDRSTLPMLYQRLLSKGVTITPLTWVRRIEEDAVVLYNVLTNDEWRIEGVDTVVISTGGKADDGIYRQLRKDVGNIYLIGHALSPRRLMDSIRDGSRVARAI